MMLYKQSRNTEMTVLLLVIIIAALISNRTTGDAAESSSPRPAPSETASVNPMVNESPIHYDDWAIMPTRPNNSSVLRVSLGEFDSYSLETVGPISEVLTLKDPKSGAKTYFILALNATLNGKQIPCAKPFGLGNRPFCAALPADLFSKNVHIAVLYWLEALSGISYKATDALVSIEEK